MKELTNTFEQYQYFKSYATSLLKSRHTIKDVGGVPLQCHYSRHIFNISLWLRKVLFSKIEEILSYMSLKYLFFT